MSDLIFGGEGGINVFVGPFQDGGTDSDNYRIDVNGKVIDLVFHSGASIRDGAKGITSEALIAILIDRLKKKNAIVPSEENEHALANLDAAMMMLVTRKRERSHRGVSGTMQA